jgi:hypothetical protein
MEVRDLRRLIRLEAAVGLGRSLADRDCVPDLAAAVRGPLAEWSPYRTIAAQTVKHAGVECLPRRQIHIPVDGFVRDPHRRVTGMLPPHHWAICCGDALTG